MSTEQRDDLVSEAIAGEFRAEMARKRITGTTLARVLGWGQQYLSRRLTGQVPLHVGEVVSIADYLEIPLDRLFARSRQLVEAGSERLCRYISPLTSANARRSARRLAYARTRTA